MNAQKDPSERPYPDGGRLDRDAALALAEVNDTAALTRAASNLRDRGHPVAFSYSRKVFIPLTQLCRDVCHYCTFAHPPRKGERAYLTPDEVLAIARAGAAAGCKEALFTLGDKPELRYRAARDELGRARPTRRRSTISRRWRELVLEETGLLPHVNPGVMTRGRHRRACARCRSRRGIMLESASPRLCETRRPALRLARQAPGGAPRDDRAARASSQCRSRRAS